MINSSYIGIIFIFAVTTVSMIRCLVYQHKLFNYLRENHTEKWKELTTVFGLGPGIQNSLRGSRFLFGKDYLDDTEVLRLKVIARNSAIYTATGFFAMFIAFFISVVVHSRQ